MAGECLRPDCRSPLACEGFGYCRERNFLPDATVNEFDRLRAGIRHAIESTTDPVCANHLRDLLEGRS